MKKGIILILVLCMVLLTGCSDIEPKEASDERNAVSIRYERHNSNEGK